jgi:hypothetical protein
LYAYTSTVQKKKKKKKKKKKEKKTPACFFCTLQRKNPYMYRNNPIGRNSNLENPIDRI